MIRSFHDVQIGVERLLSAPKDLGIDSPTLLTEGQASEECRVLFRDYLSEFRDVFDIVAEEWNMRVEEAEEQGERPESLLETGVAGPANHPLFVTFVRKYWLACARLPAGAHGAAPRPEDMLLGWLVARGLDNFVALITAMPYWPVGLDADGAWC